MGKGTKKLTNRVKEYRLQKGLTQQQLADDIGITRQTVIAIEASKYSPSLEVGFMIAQRLNAKIEEVFFYR